METVRFTQLVERAGKPELKVLWTKPEDDPEFQRAVKAQRVLTVHQNNVGSKKDFGTVGFHPEGTAQYLVFPRTVKAFANRRVVGIKYEVVEPPVAPARRSVAENVAKRKKAGSAPVRTPKLQERRQKPTDPAEPPAVAAEVLAFPSPESRRAPPDSAATERTSEARAAKSGETRQASKSEAPRHTTRGENVDTRVVAREIRSALKDLEAGKTVAAYRRLERLDAALGKGEATDG